MIPRLNMSLDCAAGDSFREPTHKKRSKKPLGCIERTLFILDLLQSVERRRRVHTGLNKGEARNALARAVFFYRLGGIRDRSFDQQQYRASELTLSIASRCSTTWTLPRSRGSRRTASILARSSRRAPKTFRRG